MRRAVKLLLAAVTVAGVVLLFAFPVRTLVEQRDQTSAAQHRLRGLTAENQKLAKQVGLLQTPAQIEQIARSKYGLVLPGQQAYGIVPASASPTTTTP